MKMKMPLEEEGDDIISMNTSSSTSASSSSSSSASSSSSSSAGSSSASSSSSSAGSSSASSSSNSNGSSCNDDRNKNKKNSNNSNGKRSSSNDDDDDDDDNNNNDDNNDNTIKLCPSYHADDKCIAVFSITVNRLTSNRKRLVRLSDLQNEIIKQYEFFIPDERKPISFFLLEDVTNENGSTSKRKISILAERPDTYTTRRGNSSGPSNVIYYEDVLKHRTMNEFTYKTIFFNEGSYKKLRSHDLMDTNPRFEILQRMFSASPYEKNHIIIDEDIYKYYLNPRNKYAYWSAFKLLLKEHLKILIHRLNKRTITLVQTLEIGEAIDKYYKERTTTSTVSDSKDEKLWDTVTTVLHDSLTGEQLDEIFNNEEIDEILNNPKFRDKRNDFPTKEVHQQIPLTPTSSSSSSSSSFSSSSTSVEKLSFASNEKETAQKLDAKVKEDKMQVKIEIAHNDKKPQPGIIINGIEYIRRSEVETAQNDKKQQPGININGIEYIRRSESQSTAATTRESSVIIDLTDDDIVPVKEEEQHVGMKRKLDVILIT